MRLKLNLDFELDLDLDLKLNWTIAVPQTGICWVANGGRFLEADVVRTVGY